MYVLTFNETPYSPIIFYVNTDNEMLDIDTIR